MSRIRQLLPRWLIVPILIFGLSIAIIFRIYMILAFLITHQLELFVSVL